MKKTLIFVISMLFIFSIEFSFISTSVSGTEFENEFGTTEAQVKLYNGKWQDIGLEDVTLKKFEPFEVRIKVTTKKECNAYIWLEETGINSTFKELKGSLEIGKEDSSPHINIPIGVTETYNWTINALNHTTKKTSLKGFVKFRIIDLDNNSYEETDEDFTIIIANISNEIWEEPKLESNNNKEENNNTYLIILIILIFLVIIIFFYFSNRKKEKIPDKKDEDLQKHIERIRKEKEEIKNLQKEIRLKEKSIKKPSIDKKEMPLKEEKIKDEVDLTKPVKKPKKKGKIKIKSKKTDSTKKKTTSKKGSTKSKKGKSSKKKTASKKGSTKSKKGKSKSKKK